MKKSKRIFLTGSIQDHFFKQFIKENADRHSVRGFLRKLDDGRVEIFLEGDHEKVNAMSEICKRGPLHSNIRKVEERDEHFQDFKEFKIFNF
nr:hypothetical protein [uncultured archaeon]AQS29493.1 hypothetical protein [uncultured archaeon]